MSVKVVGLVVAAGRGARLGGDLPKQYQPLGGRSVLAHTLAGMAQGAHVSAIMSVIRKEDAPLYAQAAAQSGVAAERLFSVEGGENRQDSVRAGLEALAKAGTPPEALVLIHDAARPFLSETMLLRALLAGLQHGAAVPVLPMADTLARFDAAGNLAQNPPREGVFSVQTPQVFCFGAILAAHRAAHAGFTDDASLAHAQGMKVTHFAGDPDLFKITQAEDLARARALVGAQFETRTGLGFDVHAFDAGDHVTLGGVQIAHSARLSGHSDADVLLHAVTDALLGTIGDGDIGAHFPPSDPQWRGADSQIFLIDALQRVRAHGGRVISVDCTLICEAPKIGPHRLAMTAKLADMLTISPGNVGIKATTSEKLGFTGRGEGIAAFAVASVRLPQARYPAPEYGGVQAQMDLAEQTHRSANDLAPERGGQDA